MLFVLVEGVEYWVGDVWFFVVFLIGGLGVVFVGSNMLSNMMFLLF